MKNNVGRLISQSHDVKMTFIIVILLSNLPKGALLICNTKLFSTSQ